MSAPPDPITAIMDCLDYARRRPEMFFGSEDGAVFVFLVGFNIACGTLGHGYDPAIYEQVVTERGWQPDCNMTIHQQMVEQGHQREAINHELLTIELDCWQRTRQP